MTAKVSSVNVGRPRQVPTARRPVSTAIHKTPVAGRVAVRGVNLDGDDQADRTVHGGPDKAVYAYAAEEIAWWRGQLGRDLGDAPFGENLTTTGLDVSGAVVGERWRIGSASFEVAQPRTPCYKLALRMDEPGFLKRFAAASRPGAYLRIIDEGDVGAGDEVVVVSRPDHGVTVRLVFDALMTDPSLIPRALRATELPVDLRDWLGSRAVRG
jgi:MOSC domain-containing protein YiiM